MAFSQGTVEFKYKDQDGDVFTLVLRRPTTDELLALRTDIRHCRTRKGDVDLDQSSEVILRFFGDHLEDFSGRYVDPKTGETEEFSLQRKPIPAEVLKSFGLRDSIDICNPMIREHAVTKLFILVDDDVEEPLRKKSGAVSKEAAKR